MVGNTDKPIVKKSDDILGVSRYINGISNFIKKCDTPMTMAIQGDWGSGKTSFMNMISEEIGDEEVAIWFNTWQFSQFNLEDRLSLILLSSLVNCLDIGDAFSDSTKQTIKKIGKIAVSLSNNVVTNLTGVDVAECIKNGSESDNIVKDITDLKSNFQKCVNSALKSKRKEKLVVFIDDLDRLPPEKAVEVLEILKLFLDCDNCVFVLAIDYDVVRRGINKKYGEDFDVKKGRSFFDKIIQVPFKMPIAQYKITDYIQTTLTKMDISTDNTQVYANLISKSIGYNPRAMKRIFNAFLLLKMVYGDEDLNSAYKQSVLFAVLCLQMSYEKIYDYIVLNEDKNITMELILSIASLNKSDTSLYKSEDVIVTDFFEKVEELDENYSEETKEFMVSFCNAIKNNNKITEEDFKCLIKILKISGTTSSTAGSLSQGNGKTGKGVRYGNTYDELFSEHSIAEKIEKTNAPTGWNACKLDGYMLFDEKYQVSSFANLVAEVLSILYKKNQDKFRKIYDNCEEYELYHLFHGTRGKEKLDAPKVVPGTEFVIETKNSYDRKVEFLRKILLAMNYEESDLILRIKLAHRVKE